MLNCKRASQLISQSLDRRLTLGERFALKFHLIICKYCKRFSQQVNTLRIAIRQMVSAVENDDTIVMPIDAKARIAKNVHL
jgi:hypothetical protein